MHVGIANPRWQGKRSWHSRRMRNPQFCVSGKRPIELEVEQISPTVVSARIWIPEENAWSRRAWRANAMSLYTKGPRPQNLRWCKSALWLWGYSVCKDWMDRQLGEWMDGWGMEDYSLPYFPWESVCVVCVCVCVCVWGGGGGVYVCVKGEGQLIYKAI